MTDAENALLLSMVEQLRDDFAAERTVRRDDHALTHGRIDEVIERLGRLETGVALASQLDTQVRGELDTLKLSLAEIRPSVDEWRRIRGFGLGMVGLMTAGGLSIGAALSWSGDTISGWIRAWLHIH